MEHIKRVGRELMYKGSMLEFYKDTIVTPDGKTVYWDHIEHKGAAAVVAVRDDGRIIMVRQFRNSPDKYANVGTVLFSLNAWSKLE